MIVLNSIQINCGQIIFIDSTSIKKSKEVATTLVPTLLNIGCRGEYCYECVKF